MEDEEVYTATGDAVAEGHVGTELQAKRLELGRELSEIAQQTRVPLRHLTAIESGDHSSLPALPYTVGFVKAYARSVGLDPDAAAARFRAETTMTEKEPSAIIVNSIDERRSPPRSAMFLGLLLVGLVALGVIAWASGMFAGDGVEEDAEVAEVEPVPDDPVIETAGAPLSQDEQAAAFEPQEGEMSASTDTAGGAIVIRAREDAWVKIYEAGSGRSVQQGVMASGETFTVPAERSDLLLWTGRAGALEVTVGGTSVGSLGGMAETIRDIPLTPAGLDAAADDEG